MATNVGSVSIAVTGNTDPLNDSLKASIKAVEQYAAALSESMRDSEKDVAKSTAKAGGDVEEFSEGSLGLIEGFAAGFSAAITGFVIEKLVEMGATFMEVATRGMEFAGEVNTAMKTVQAQTGASSEEMVGLKDSMMGVYSSGFVDNMEESAAAISAVSRITGETGDALIETTTDALAFSKAFDSDVNTVMAATRGMMDGFGISAEQSMDLAAYAIQKTGDPAGDLLDTLTEYSPLMEKVGLSAEQFTAALMGGLEGGAFNTDLIGDAFKEFGISLMDPVEDVGARMATVMAAAGDEGAQAWLDIQDEIDAASEAVDGHKETLDAAKEEWTKTNDKVREYQSELDKAWGDLQKLLNPNMELSEFTDKIDEIEGKEIEVKLALQPIEDEYEAAKKTLDDQLKGIDDRVESQREKIKAQQQKLRKAESDEEKAAIQANIDALNEELTALSDSKDALRDSFDNSAAKRAYEAKKEQLEQYDQEIEQQNLLMQQEQRRQRLEDEGFVESQGYSVAEIKGQKTKEQHRNDLINGVNRHREAQENLNAASADENVAKQQLDQSQASYDQAVAYLENLKAKFADMPNPGVALAEDLKKGGPEAAAAMQELAKNLMIAKETMSDTDFQALVRDMGVGTLAEELGADALGGIFSKILDPGDIAAQAAGTVDDVADTLVDRWTQAWNRLDVVLGSLGTSFGDVWATVLPGFEAVVEMAEKILPPILKELGGVLGESMKNITPLITEVIKYLAAEGLVTFMAIAKAIGLILPPITKFLGDNAGWLGPLVAWLLTLAGILGTGGAIYGGIMSLIASLAPLWAMVAPFMAGGAMSAAFATVTAGLSSVVAFLSPIIAPLALIGLAVAALYYAWTTNLGGIQEITWSVLGGVTTFITTKFGELQTWWAAHNTEVLARFNAAWGALGILINLALMPVMAAIEAFRLFWGTFGDDIINIIQVGFLNATTIIIGGFVAIKEGFSFFLAVIKGDWSGAWEHLQNIVTVGKNVITDVLNNILSIFGTNIDEVVDYFSGLPGRIAAYFSPEALIQIATDAMQAFSDTITAMMPSLPSPGDFVPDLGGVMSSAQNLVSDTAGRISGAIPNPTSNSFNQTLNFPQPGADAETIRRVVRQDTINIMRQATG